MTIRNRKTLGLSIVLLAPVMLLAAWSVSPSTQPETAPPEPTSDAAPTSDQDSTSKSPADELSMTELSMAELLAIAESVHRQLEQSLTDYTARFVKQEVDTNGELGEETEMWVKIQTHVRNETNDAPKRVYLKFLRPESNQGREVLWGEDLHRGKMAVHENYFPLSLKTIWLDPNGYLAMQGQKYPISEIGLVRLVEKLIERGKQDLKNPDISISIDRAHVHDDRPAHLIRVTRSKPSGDENDFSLAEVTVDPERNLVVGYRSFGWPEKPDLSSPLLESYYYHDLEINTDLKDEDFDPTNPDYAFP